MSTKKKIRKFKIKKEIKFDIFKNKSPQELIDLSKQLLIDLEENPNIENKQKQIPATANIPIHAINTSDVFVLS